MLRQDDCTLPCTLPARPPFVVVRVHELLGADTIDEASDLWAEIAGNSILSGSGCCYAILDSHGQLAPPAVSDEELAEIAAESICSEALPF